MHWLPFLWWWWTWNAEKFETFRFLPALCLTACLVPWTWVDVENSEQGHMVAVLRSCMWQITFSTSDSHHSGDRGEGLKWSNTPSGILQAATNPIYLYLWPVSNLSVELTSATERVRSAVVSPDKTNFSDNSNCLAQRKRADSWDFQKV